MLVEIRDYEYEESQYDIGDRVIYAPWHGPNRSAVIEGVDAKNGRVVYDLSDGHWCYEDQILSAKKV